MPQQEIFLEKPLIRGRVLVIKTYDLKFAREAFQSLSEDALLALASALSIHDLYDETDIPKPNSAEYSDFLWEAVLDEAREDGSVCSPPQQNLWADSGSGSRPSV
jgi:hypothetical protein